MIRRVKAEHQVVYETGKDNLLGYFGWPTVAAEKDGSLTIGVSGFRNSHVCPFGQNVIFRSTNSGKTWSEPESINNSQIDDRDVGLTAMNDEKLLLSWFTSDTRFYFKGHSYARPNRLNFRSVIDSWSDELVQSQLGSFIRTRDDKGIWGRQIPVKVSAPHGPIQLRDGRLFYLGAPFGKYDTGGKLHFSMETLHCMREIQAVISSDGGETWTELGYTERASEAHVFCEPHAIELPDGRIIGMLRCQSTDYFAIWQTDSLDCGRTWSKPKFVTNGSPPHLMRHSSGVLICTYGYRSPGYGQRVMFSRDNGASWDTDWIIRDDGFNGDLGYPSSVELPDGSMYTVYYQASSEKMNCGVLASKWTLPF